MLNQLKIYKIYIPINASIICMKILNLEYPQFKIEDEVRRLKENAKYLRSVYFKQ